jgi:hypothetical protein
MRLFLAHWTLQLRTVTKLKKNRNKSANLYKRLMTVSLLWFRIYNQCTHLGAFRERLCGVSTPSTKMNTQTWLLEMLFTLTCRII